jgi:hypothetical protein
MALFHKFENFQFNADFQTNNSVLNVVPYFPEVFFIGTFNHGWSWNTADFFYGRDMFMWTILANLFIYNSNVLKTKRTVNIRNPSFDEILEICNRGKLSFADIVKGVKENVSAVEDSACKMILVNNKFEWRSYKDSPIDFMGANNWLDDNVSSIVDYINETKSIRHVYFTFKSGRWLVNRKNEICLRLRKNVSYCSIFTPTANGFGKPLPAPFHERPWGLTHCWVWNGLQNEFPINRPNFGHLDHDWLKSKGIDPQKF